MSLQRDDLLGHARHARLRGVDHREPLVELAEVGAGRLGVAFEPGAERALTLSSRSDITRARSAWREPQPFAQRAEPAAEFGVRLREPGELRLELAPSARGGLRLAPPRRMARSEGDEQRQQQRRASAPSASAKVTG